MPLIYLSLGSNIDRERNIQAALFDLENAFGTLLVSSIYETAAVGFDGAPFYNLVVGFESSLPIDAIAETLADIENRHGRTRDCKKFASRTLDIDLLLYGDLNFEKGKLKLPRPDLLKYAFMLEPLAEIAPDQRHPTANKTFAELWADYDKTNLQQIRLKSARQPSEPGA